MKCIVVLLVIALVDFGYGRQVTSRARGTSATYLTRPNQAVNIRIMIHLDPVLTLKLAKEHKSKNRKKLKNISYRLLKEVESFFHHRSLNQTIRFQLIDTRFLKNATHVVTMDENASKYLKSYCDWQGRRKSWRKRWYYSVLLTGLDLYYVDNRGQEVRRSSGRGYKGGLCSMKKSCTVIEWQPKNMGFLLAHEIAHSLNVNHDGPPFNRCTGNHVMSTKYNTLKHPKSWSPCSQQDLKKYLQSGKSWCTRSIL